MTVAATKLVFQFAAVAISLYFLYWTYASLLEAAAAGVFQPQPLAIRLMIVGLRDTAVPPTVCNPVLFGLLRDGCNTSAVANTSNGSAVVVLPTNVRDSRVNGYYLKISAGGPAARDPVQWIVEAQAAEDGIWLPVGASVSRGQGAFATFFPSLQYPTPVSAKNQSVLVIVDRRPSWQWLLTDVGTYAIAGLGWLAYAAAGMTGRQLRAVGWLSGLFSCNSGLQAVAAVGYCAAGDWRAGTEAWMNCAAVLCMAVVLLSNERLVVKALILFGSITLFALVRFTPCCSIHS